MTEPPPMRRPRFADQLDLAAAPTAVSCARMFTEATLVRWHAMDIVEPALNVVTELVIKAVKASDELDLITIGLAGLEASIVIGVWDSDPYPPDLPEDAHVRWKLGSYPVDRGKVVWVELPVSPCTPHGPSRRQRKPTPHPPQPPAMPGDDKPLRRVRDGLKGW